MRPTLLALTLLATTATSSKAQWDLQHSLTTADLRGIDYVGNGVAWASGTDGTVLRTEDLGYMWQHCTTPPGAEHLDFRGIQAFDNQTAIVMSSGKGDLSRLYKTTDGCQTWTLVLTNPDKEGFWDALAVASHGPYIDGMVMGDPVDGAFPIFLTTDAGSTWRQYGHGGPGWKSGCKEASARSRGDEGLYAASNQAAVFFPDAELDVAFVTGGKSGSRFTFAEKGDWDGSLCSVRFRSWNLRFKTPSSTTGAFAVAATGSGSTMRLVIVGGDYLTPDQPTNSFLVRQKYANFVLPGMASNFRQAPVMSQSGPHGYRSAVAYDPTHKLWITVGPNGTDISTDDGRNWHPLKPRTHAGDPPDADQHWNALSLPFAVGPHGRIGILEDKALPPQ